MRRHLRKPGVWIAALILLALWLLWPRPVSSPPVVVPTPTPTTASSTGVETADSALPAFLPREARETIQRIQSGGQFPHRQDGSVFGNREGRLPAQPRGYYREYTVTTPGISHRGARRIVTGGRPPVVWYYSDDHYDSFRAFTVPAVERAQ